MLTEIHIRAHTNIIYINLYIKLIDNNINNITEITSAKHMKLTDFWSFF